MHYNLIGDNVIKEIIYRGEGNSSIVIALKNQAKVIRLLKKDGKIMKSSLDHHAKEHPMRSIKFIHLIMKPLTEPFLSCATELIHLKSNFINLLSENVEVYRPLHRLNKTLLLDDQYALVMDDLCTLPNHVTQRLDANNLCGPTLSVEIKPKQGFLPIYRSAMKSSVNEQSNVKLRNCCIYGSNQQLKLARGRIAQTNNYCPINLFSGCPTKMRNALEELIHNPQNNLRVFKNLILAYGENKQEIKLSNILEEFFTCNMLLQQQQQQQQQQDNLSISNNETRFIGLLIQCLLNDHQTNDYDARDERMTIDNENSFCNATDTCSKHQAIVKCQFCDDLPSGDFRQDVSLHRLPQSCVLYNVLKAQKLDTIGAHEALNMLNWLIENAKTDKSMDILEELSKPQLPPGFGSTFQLANESKEQYYFRKVWEFLVSLTAKDCSIIITIRQITPGHCETILRRDPMLKKQILRDRSSGNYYVFNVGIADLDQKMPLKIPRICDNLNLILQSRCDYLKLDTPNSSNNHRQSKQKALLNPT